MLLRSFWGCALIPPFKTHLCMSIEKMESSGGFERHMCTCKGQLRCMWECGERQDPRGNSRSSRSSRSAGRETKSDCEDKAEKLEGRRIGNFLVLDKSTLDDLSEYMFSYAQKILFLCEENFIRDVELMVCFPSELKFQQSPGFWQVMSEKNPETKWGKSWDQADLAVVLELTLFSRQFEGETVLSPPEATTRTELE